MRVNVKDMQVSLARDKAGKIVIDPEQVLFIARSGGAKSLSVEKIVELLHEAGYLIIYLVDIKDNFEAAFAMFEPQELYHLKILEYEGQKQNKKKVKLYHPFSFSIPKNKLLPDIRFFSYNIKDLGRDELSLILESDIETNTVKLCLNALKGLKYDEGLCTLLHNIQKQVVGVTKRISLSQSISLPNPDNFWLSTASAGNVKNIEEVSLSFKPFLNYYFLAPSNAETNLDVVTEIFRHQEAYHVLVQRWVDDEKIKDFNILFFFNLILKNIDECKSPICFVIEEVSRIVPRDSTGYKRFLAGSLRDKLSTIRNMGRGCYSLMTAQAYIDVDSKISSRATQEFKGELTSRDIAYFMKNGLISRYDLEALNSLESNCFLMKGYEGFGSVHFLFPTHAHKESFYNFFEMYKKFYPEQMRNYRVLYDDMLKRKKVEEELVKEKVLSKVEKQQKVYDGFVKKKEERIKMKEKQFLGKADLNVEKQKLRVEKARLFYDEYVGGKSLREIAAKFGIDKSTVKKHIKEHVT